jgi:hypothetical protein
MSARDRADQAAELPYESIPAGPIARRGASHRSGHVAVVEAPPASLFPINRARLLGLGP